MRACVELRRACRQAIRSLPVAAGGRGRGAVCVAGAVRVADVLAASVVTARQLGARARTTVAVRNAHGRDP